MYILRSYRLYFSQKFRRRSNATLCDISTGSLLFAIVTSLGIYGQQGVKWFYMYSYPYTTVLPAKSDSDIMFCLQSYQGLRIDRLAQVELYFYHDL